MRRRPPFRGLLESGYGCGMLNWRCSWLVPLHTTLTSTTPDGGDTQQPRVAPVHEAGSTWAQG